MNMNEMDPPAPLPQRPPYSSTADTPVQEFAMQSEDFPALPGAKASGPSGGPPKHLSEEFGIGLGSPSPHPHNMEESKMGASASSGGGTPDQYGLLGLLNVIRMTDPDLNTLALGSDLTTLGLNLNASESLYTTFASPWAEGPTTKDPKFFLPVCYNMSKQGQTPKIV